MDEGSSEGTKVCFDVWGCRGSRNLVPGRSRIGVLTSCYSLLCGDALLIFDAGRGIAALGDAMTRDPRFIGVRSIRVFVSHAHVDHWEGLKDVDWFWQRNNGLDVRVHGPPEALGAIREGYLQPHYVPLDVLAMGTVAELTYHPLEAPGSLSAGPFAVEVHPLHHYSGMGAFKRSVQSFGFRVSVEGGPTVAYISDHEPTADTAAMEREMLRGAHLALYDAAYGCIADHAFGHGSLEYAAQVARAHPSTLILGGHHGPTSSDESVETDHRRHGGGAGNFALAVEGASYRWDAGLQRFCR